MADRPEIAPGEWINVGEKWPHQVKAVVCTVYDESPFDCEVVFLDERNRAINEEVKWTGTYWGFAAKGPSGGYADNYSRLSRYVGILRADQPIKENRPRRRRR